MALGLLDVAFEVGGRSLGEWEEGRKMVADAGLKYLFQVSFLLSRFLWYWEGFFGADGRGRRRVIWRGSGGFMICSILIQVVENVETRGISKEAPSLSLKEGSSSLMLFHLHSASWLDPIISYFFQHHYELSPTYSPL